MFLVHLVSALRLGAGSGDRSRLSPRCGVRVGVRVEVSLQPDAGTDPPFRLTPQAWPAVDAVGLSCDRPCLVSGLPLGLAFRTGKGGGSRWMIRFFGSSPS